MYNVIITNTALTRSTL